MKYQSDISFYSDGGKEDFTYLLNWEQLFASE